jgi:hypothetical protein
MGVSVRRAIVPVIVVVLMALFAPFAQGREHEDDQGADCGRSSTGAIPITDLGEATYEGAQGGLYPDGSNTIPPDHEAAGLGHAAQIEPLDGAGNPDPDGAIAVISIGVSNTNREFQDFITIVEGKTAPAIVLVNAAQAGEGISKWADPNSSTWSGVDAALSAADVAGEQVQAAWVKVVERISTWDELEPFPVDAQTYQDQLVEVLRIATDRYPNLRIAYLSSRIYGGYSTNAFPSPEPLTYENGFGVKWTIEEQIDGALELNQDADLGPVEAPWLAWGPYLWADGTTARSDGLMWDCRDLRRDGTHPTSSGIRKVATMLAEHFLSAPTAVPWFTSTGAPIELGELPPIARQGINRVAPDDSDETRQDREQGTRSRTSTTVANSTSTLDEPPVDVDAQAQPTNEPGDPRSSSSASLGLILAVSVLVLAVLLGVAALMRSRRREAD